VHGEYRMLCKHAELAKEMGIKPNHILVGDNGAVIELSEKKIVKSGEVPSGDILVDGSGNSGIGSDVLSDRKHMAEEGVVVASIVISEEDSSLIAPPEIVTRGFADGNDAELMEKNLSRIVWETLEYCDRKRIYSLNTIKSKIKANFSGFMYKTVRRSPMIVVSIHRI